MANKRFMDFTTDATPSGSNFLLEADSVNGVRKTTIENAVAGTNVVTNMSSKVTNVFYDNAAAHNSIYRGKDLTAYFDSGDMSAAIAAGTFDDIYIGDYITKTIELPAMTYTNKSGTEVTQDAQTFENAKWVVMGIDAYYQSGSVPTLEHHVLLMSNYALQQARMNPTNSTAGGYVGSDMWTKHMPNWSTAVKNAFGNNHVLNHYEVLTKGINTTVQSTAGGFLGKSNDYDFYETVVNIPSESMIYGGQVFGSSFDVGSFPKKLPFFAFKNWFDGDFSSSWLRDIASSERFSSRNGNGLAGNQIASLATLGIRPYFLLK